MACTCPHRSGIWQNWNAAAQALLSRQARPEKALEYAQKGNSTGFGAPNFTTLATLSQAQAANGMAAESEATFAEAIAHPTADPGQIHQAGRQLILQGRKDEAMKVFQANYDRFEGAWPTEVGMVRGLSAVGSYAEALEHAKKALAQARERNDAANVPSLEAMIPKLEAGEDIN